MAAPEGNKYYLERLKDGRDKYYTPESFMDIALDYFEWAEENPFKEELVFHSQGIITKDFVTKKRAFSINALCIHAGICTKTFNNYEKAEDFVLVTTRIRDIIECQQFDGATTGFFNPNIIARKLGLTDKSEVTTITEQPLFPD